MRFTIVAALGLAAVAHAQPVSNTIDTRLVHIKLGGKGDKSPFSFTSTYSLHATPEEVVDSNNAFTGGLAGASGVYKFGINSHDNIICYNITLSGFQGEYQSPAVSATHIHEAARGRAGPPRIAFPNPVEIGPSLRSSIGCIRGPFTTGVLANGKDTGEGFHVRQIEENPAGFFADVHSSLAVPGAVRGQLEKNC
uniref:CHRD domain-containing protein n=1 Tax=Bionectria ochroleuca TaxID=29856 RepID=A0A8H7K3K1_BIOOC